MAITTNPEIYTRAQWNALPIDSKNLALRTDSLKYILIHHSAGYYNNGEPSEGTAVRDIQKEHLDNEFGDIGYNYCVGYFGTIFEGRNLKYVGAHCNTNKKNYDSIGICVPGNFELSIQKFSTYARESLISLLISLCKKHNISPDNIYGHKDFGSTDCPGKKLYAELPGIIKEVKKYVNTSTPSPSGEYEVKRYSESGTCYPETTINFRSTPNAENPSNILGQYFKGEHVFYDLVVQTNKYVYISWIGASSGTRRYMAVRDLITGERWATCV